MSKGVINKMPLTEMIFAYITLDKVCGKFGNEAGEKLGFRIIFARITVRYRVPRRYTKSFRLS